MILRKEQELQHTTKRKAQEHTWGKMTFLFEPVILENPRILTVSVGIPSGCTIDVIFKCNFKDWCNPGGSRGERKPRG